MPPGSIAKLYKKVSAAYPGSLVEMYIISYFFGLDGENSTQISQLACNSMAILSLLRL